MRNNESEPSIASHETYMSFWVAGNQDTDGDSAPNAASGQGWRGILWGPTIWLRSERHPCPPPQLPRAWASTSLSTTAVSRTARFLRIQFLVWEACQTLLGRPSCSGLGMPIPDFSPRRTRRARRLLKNRWSVGEKPTRHPRHLVDRMQDVKMSIQVFPPCTPCPPW